MRCQRESDVDLSPYITRIEQTIAPYTAGVSAILLFTRFLKLTIIRASAQSNLENYIYIGFRAAVVEISNNSIPIRD